MFIHYFWYCWFFNNTILPLPSYTSTISCLRYVVRSFVTHTRLTNPSLLQEYQKSSSAILFKILKLERRRRWILSRVSYLCSFLTFSFSRFSYFILYHISSYTSSLFCLIFWEHFVWFNNFFTKKNNSMFIFSDVWIELS